MNINVTNNNERPRRAFRDLSNAHNNINGKAKDEQPLAKKRNIPVLSRRQGNNVAQEKQVEKVHIQVERKQVGATSRAQFPNEMADTNRASYQFTGQLDNIDNRDMNDPLCVTEYVMDIYEHYHEKETSTSVKPIYMERQPHINERMRSILIDWLIEVHQKFKLVPETLYLTVNVIDRYLEKANVSRQKLQLLGVTALLLASKYEEIYPPEISDFIYICDSAYDKQQILSMEQTILKVLCYQMTIPSAHAFLVRFLKAAHADRKMVQLSCYILDGTLQSYTLLHYLPSQLAAAAVLIARKVVGRNAWSPTLLKYAGYCEEDILPVARAIVAEKSSSTSDCRGVDKKYSSSRYGGIARTKIEIDL